MATDRFLEMVGKPGGPLADASLFHLEVLDAGALSPSMRRLVFTAPDLGGLRYLAGQDLMFRIPRGGDAVTNRRYTIRSSDPVRASVTVDVSLHGAGPGTDWVRAACPGDRIDAIGPRGKVTLREGVHWHLFVADEAGMPGVLAMLETLPANATAEAWLEVDGPADEQELAPREGSRVELHWLHRLDRSAPGDASLFQAALDGAVVPAGGKHAYVAAEAAVVRSVQKALIDKGFDQGEISAKAYWRRGLPNADHGEPARSE